MFNDQQFAYFSTIRRTIVAFGTLFDKIYISRYASNGDVLKTIKVPLAYAAGEKWLSHLKENVHPPTANIRQNQNSGVKTKITLPRMSFEMLDIQYDSKRKLQTTGTGSVAEHTNDVNKLLKQLNPVPYDYMFNLNIATKNIDDGFQIIEQILPNFSPSFNLTIKDIPELNITKDVPIIFGGITKYDTWQGSYEQARILNWTLSFVVKGYLYPAITDGDVIKKVIANIKDQKTQQTNSIVITRVDPIEAEKTDEWSIKTKIYEDDEIDSNGEAIEDSNS